MYDTLFWSLLTGNVLLAIYIAVNPKMHAQPWRFFALGTVLFLAMFWLQDSTDTVAKLVGDGRLDRFKSGIQLLTTSVVALVGALFGTAVTNRAQFLHKKEIAIIMDRLKTAEILYLQPAEALYARLTDQSKPLSSDELHRLIDQRRELLFTYRVETQALSESLQRLQA